MARERAMPMAPRVVRGRARHPCLGRLRALTRSEWLW